MSYLGPLNRCCPRVTVLPWMIYAPCPWKAENFGLYGTIILQNQVLVPRHGDAVQLVVPQSMHSQLFTHAHAGPLAAHLGSQRMLAQLRRLYYWPGMRKDIDAWCRQCEGCAISRGPPSRPHGHLRKVSAGAPTDLVAIDILSGLPATADGYKLPPCGH